MRYHYKFPELISTRRAESNYIESCNRFRLGLLTSQQCSTSCSRRKTTLLLTDRSRRGGSNQGQPNWSTIGCAATCYSKRRFVRQDQRTCGYVFILPNGGALIKWNRNLLGTAPGNFDSSTLFLRVLGLPSSKFPQASLVMPSPDVLTSRERSLLAFPQIVLAQDHTLAAKLSQPSTTTRTDADCEKSLRSEGRSTTRRLKRQDRSRR